MIYSSYTQYRLFVDNKVFMKLWFIFDTSEISILKVNLSFNTERKLQKRMKGIVINIIRGITSRSSMNNRGWKVVYRSYFSKLIGE